jgi:RHS repeat-associated protein
VGVTLAYNQVSLPESMTYVSRNRRTLGYDELHRLTSDSLTTADGVELARIGYGWDGNDNLTSKATLGFGGAGATISNTYGYDLADRLGSWNNGVTTTDYAYDGAGNRVRSGDTTATYDERNRLVSTASGSRGSASYTYTARGTLSETVTSAGTQHTTVDAFGQVTRQDAASGKTSSYTYDGLGRLTGEGLSYTGVGNTLASDGSTLYTRDPGGDVVGAADGAAKTLAWVDEHSDVVAQFTADGTALVGSRVFDPWGEILATTGILGNLGYQSGWTDADTGRVNMSSRWYNPVTGGFDTRDAANVSPVGADSIGANRYAYANANPLSMSDPAGTWPSWNSIKNAVKKVANTVVSVAKAVYNNVILPVVNAVVSVVKAVVNVVKSAVNWVANKVSAAVNWVSQQAAAARSWVASKAEQARRAATAALVVMHQKAAAALAKAQRVYAETRQKVKDAFQATGAWIAEHKSMLIEIAAIGVGVLAGIACTFATAGAGAVACMAGSMALINLAKDAAQGNIHNFGDAFGSLGKGALQGLAAGAGGVVGGKLASFAAGKLGGLATSLGGRMLTGALEGAGEDVVDQLMTTGTVDLGSVGMSALIGGATGGRAHAGGHTSDLRRATDAVTPSPRRQLSGDSGTQSPGSASSGGSSPSNGCTSCSCQTKRHSFDPDTRVVMADGSSKPIKSIQVGDQVKATYPDSGANAPKTVTVLHDNQDTDLTDVTVTNPDGTAGLLATTQHHPFWDATTGAWVLAKDLTPGHQLHTPNGDTVTVTKVVNRDVTATGGTNMRDLTIADIHTYYVIAGNTPVLVHNAGGGCKEVVLDSFDSFEQARNTALDLIGEIDPATRQPYVGRLESAPTTYGKVVGFTTRVNGVTKRFRMDYDPDKGPHINVEIGKGSSAQKWAVPWNGTEKQFARLLRGNI